MTPLTEIELFTQNGDLVTTIEIAQLPNPYEIIVWGKRFFYLKDGQYVEGLVCIVNQVK